MKPFSTLTSQHAPVGVSLTVLLGKLLRFLIRNIPLGLQVGFISYENDHLMINTREESVRRSPGHFVWEKFAV